MNENIKLEANYNDAMSQLTIYKKRSSQFEGAYTETSNGYEQYKNKY